MAICLNNPRVAALALAFVTVGTVAATPSRPPVWLQASSSCRANDQLGTALIHDLKLWVSGTDTVAVINRTVFNVPQMSPDSVSAVSNSTKCQRAALAYGRNLSPPDTPTARRVYVARVGPTRYVVTDTSIRKGEFVATMVFDSTFTTKLADVAN